MRETEYQEWTEPQPLVVYVDYTPLLDGRWEALLTMQAAEVPGWWHPVGCEIFNDLRDAVHTVADDHVPDHD